VKGTADSSGDRETVARQLGREPRPFRVAARCPYGAPSVIENEPGRDMPTRFWVTCPSLVREISRVESAGGVQRVWHEVGEKEVMRVHEEHRARYGSRVAGVREGGRVKCLHAFTALHLAGAIPNPVARWTLERLRDPYPEDGCCSR
jgi:hypothetical protein